jgi:hypothetical protein
MHVTPLEVDIAAGRCDLGTVNFLARLALHARRTGREVRLVGATPELLELIALAGLSPFLRPAAVSRDAPAARTAGRTAPCRGRTSGP